MNSKRIMLVMTAIAALSFSSMALARGGSMGGGYSGSMGTGSMGGGSTMTRGTGNMQNNYMRGSGGNGTAMSGKRAHSSGQGNMGTSTGNQRGSGHGHGHGTGRNTT